MDWVTLADLTPELIERMDAWSRIVAAHEGRLDEA